MSCARQTLPRLGKNHSDVLDIAMVEDNRWGSAFRT